MSLKRPSAPRGSAEGGLSSKDALSATQRQALKLLDRGGFVKVRAGWHPADSGNVGAFNGQTILSLARRGLVRFKLRGNVRQRPTSRLRAAACSCACDRRNSLK